MKSQQEPIVRPTPQAAGALAALRGATRERHIRIDRLIDLRRMQDRGHYGRVLRAFDAFLGPWEDSVAMALPASRHGWLHARSRRQFLHDDLLALGLRPLADPPFVPAMGSAAAAWGSLYVIEGSALGGQAIARALARFGLGPGSGASYFEGWGDDTHGMWQEFAAQLETELADPASVAAACAAACGTFDALTAHLQSVLHERTDLLAQFVGEVDS